MLTEPGLCYGHYFSMNSLPYIYGFLSSKLSKSRPRMIIPSIDFNMLSIKTHQVNTIKYQLALIALNSHQNVTSQHLQRGSRSTVTGNE